MTAVGEDFGGYVVARWPELVRTLVLLGCPEGLAADVALDALARCQRGWARRVETSDVDGEVRGELVDAWERRRGRSPAWWPTEAAVDSDIADALDRLTPPQRTALVLDRYVGAPVGAGPSTSGAPTADQLRALADQVLVLAPPSPGEITERRRRERRRRTARGLRLTLAAVVPLLVVAAGLTWFADRTPAPAPDLLGPLSVTRVENPIGVVWEAGGVLHLPHGTVDAPVVRQLAPLGDGALYADQAGRVVELAGDGVRTVLGRENTAIGFVSSDTRGWVAWVDPTGERPRLVVVDVAARRDVGRLTVSGDVRPVAIDGSTVYLRDADGVRGWQPLTRDRPAPVVEPAVLVAAAASTRVYQSGRTQLRMSPYLGVELAVTGVGGRLSADGTLLATRTSGDAGGDGPVAIYDTATGASLQTGVEDDELALDVALGPDQTVSYLIARKADRPQGDDELRASFAGSLQLRTCRLYLADVAPTCALVTDIPVSGVSPMLAH